MSDPNAEGPYSIQNLLPFRSDLQGHCDEYPENRLRAPLCGEMIMQGDVATSLYSLRSGKKQSQFSRKFVCFPIWEHTAE